VAVSVADNTTTLLRATATDLAGNPSRCSTVRKYVEDSKAPPAPSIKATMPNSPANNNQPRLRGFAAAPGTVSLYTTNRCAGSPVSSGTASQFHTTGLPASVADNSTTTFRAKVVDLAGNASRCSAPRTYVEDSAAPDTTITGGPLLQTTSRRPTFQFEASEPGSTFQCSLDSQPFGRCSGPGASHTPYVALSFGSHTFSVRAIDAASNRDPTPAQRTFAVIP
jgi:hypothetical protein